MPPSGTTPRRISAEMHIAVDPSWNAISHGYPRPCLLQHFSIPVTMKERPLFDRIVAPVKPWLHAASAPFRKMLRIQVFNEQEADRYCFLRDLPLEPGVKTLYLWGYFQNHAMVEEVAGELRLDLTFREPPQGKTLELMQQIGRCKTPGFTPCAPGGLRLIPVEGKVVLQKEYYANAIAIIKERFVDPTFFVFRTISRSLSRTWRSIPGQCSSNTMTPSRPMRICASCLPVSTTSSPTALFPGGGPGSTPDRIKWS